LIEIEDAELKERYIDDDQNCAIARAKALDASKLLK